MKKYQNLFEQLLDFYHLHRSFRKAMRSSGHRKDGQYFAFHLEKELLKLQSALQEGSWKPDPYIYFKIFEPKERIISAASFRDRVMHHALIGVLEPIYERCFIYHSYATRKGKGVHMARAKAQQFVRKYPCFLKCDVHKYFDSIDHLILKEMLRKKIEDEAFLKPLEAIIDHAGKSSKGLPIGNLTSQFLANVYLNPFDHFVKEKLRVKGYLRYMDDFVLFGNCLEDLKSWRKEIELFWENHLQLHLKQNATILNRTVYGLSFLGARIYGNTMRIQRDNFRRTQRKLARKVNAYQQGELSEMDLQMAMTSHFAYLEGFDSWGLRRKMDVIFPQTK